MIYSVTGKVTHIEQNAAVIETGGVGFFIKASKITLSNLSIGTEASLLTHMSVREDAMELFGFADSEELSVFRMLTSVSGVGGKVALSILSELTAREFAMAAAFGDHNPIQRASGVGAKLAQRIVLELKDKLGKQTGGASSATVRTSAGSAPNPKAEALSALIVLGFTPSQSAAALEQTAPGTSTSDMIKQALKTLSS